MPILRYTPSILICHPVIISIGVWTGLDRSICITSVKLGSHLVFAMHPFTSPLALVEQCNPNRIHIMKGLQSVVNS